MDGSVQNADTNTQMQYHIRCPETIPQHADVKTVGGEMSKMKCYFSSGICESLTCCKDGLFDFYGYPKNYCKDFPCQRYVNLVRELEDSERHICPEWS